MKFTRGFHSKPGQVKGRFSELEDNSVEVTKSKKGKE